MNVAPAPIVVLISGRGSNLKAIIEAAQTGQLSATVAAVISNLPEAPGLDAAVAAGIPTRVVDHRPYADRDAFDRELIGAIDRYQPRLVVLAGFMRILGRSFIDHYSGRLINIHPSLLPAYKGLHTHARALADGVTEHGATVHFVTNDLDGGPIIVQQSVPVLRDDTEPALSARVLDVEHRLLPLAIEWFVQGRITIRDGQVMIDGEPRSGVYHLPGTPMSKGRS